MGFLDNLIRGAEYRAGPTTTLANPANWLLDAFASTKTASGQRVTAQRSLGLAPVWSAVSIIAEKIGEQPLVVYRDLGDGKKVEATDHRAYRMLHDMPNPVTPANRFWSTVAVHLLLWGNAFVTKHRSDITGLVEELWLLDPAHVIVEWNGAQKRFTEQTATGAKNVYSADDVLHITGLSLNGLVGESVITRCRNMLGTVMAREDFEAGFYGRGATMRGIIKHPQKIGDDAIKNLREYWTALFGGSGKAHQTAVLEEGADFIPISMPLSDMEFVAAQQLSRTDIAVMFKLPPAYLGGSTGDSLTYATVESNQIQFATNAISPLTTTIAKAVGTDLGIFPFQSWYPEFDLEGLMRGDHASRGNWYKDLASVRAITPNEIRERENMPPLPDGDVVGAPTQERISETAQLQPDGTVAPIPAATNTLVPAAKNGTATANGKALTP